MFTVSCALSSVVAVAFILAEQKQYKQVNARLQYKSLTQGSVFYLFSSRWNIMEVFETLITKLGFPTFYVLLFFDSFEKHKMLLTVELSSCPCQRSRDMCQPIMVSLLDSHLPVSSRLLSFYFFFRIWKKDNYSVYTLLY